MSGSNSCYIGSNTIASGSTVNNEIILGAGLTGKGTQSAYIGGSVGCYNAANLASFLVTSDKRIKKNIVNTSKGLADIMKL